jgi:predicted MFS family arabinose efflux permease
MYFGSFASFVALQWWPALRRRSAGLGLAILALGLVTSSFARRVWQLILTQGALYAIGGILLYSSVCLLVDEWFVRKKGIAFGVMWAGTGFSGISVPYIFSWGLSHFSFRTMLRAWALAVVVLCAPLLYYVKPRIPISQASSVRRFNMEFALSRKFIFLEVGNVLEGLGYFVPSIYLPTYARSIGLSSAATAATVAVLNGAAVFGCIFIGILVDHFHVTTVIAICTIGAVVSVLVFWGLATSISLLLVFSAAYGFFAGSYSSCWTGMIKEVKREHNAANTGVIFSFLAAGRGIGSIACGPLSEALLKGRLWKGEAALGYGTGYGSLIVYTGVTALLGGLTFGAKRLGMF